jgi:hypothetical protein
MATGSATSTLVRTHELDTDSNNLGNRLREETIKILRGIYKRHKEP